MTFFRNPLTTSPITCKIPVMTREIPSEITPESMNLKMFGGNAWSHKPDFPGLANILTENLKNIADHVFSGVDATIIPEAYKQGEELLENVYDSHKNAENILEAYITDLATIATTPQSDLVNNPFVITAAEATKQTPSELIQTAKENIKTTAKDLHKVVLSTNNSLPTIDQESHKGLQEMIDLATTRLEDEQVKANNKNQASK